MPKSSYNHKIHKSLIYQIYQNFIKFYNRFFFMGEKKKHKDKKKNKKKTKQHSREKKKKRSSSSQSSSQSRSRSRNKKPSKSKKKQKNQSSKEILRNPEPQDTTFLLNYGTPRQASGFVLPVLRNMPPPPVAPQTASTAPVPKTKSKEINLFKLMPKLPYGPLTLARTIFMSDLIEPEIFHKELKQICNEMQKTAKAENYKKAASNMTKCINQIEKIEECRKSKGIDTHSLTDNGQNRYKQLDRVLQKHLEQLKRVNKSKNQRQ